MFKVATRGLFARKLRLALTTLAVVLRSTRGVAAAQGSVFDTGTILGKNGKRISSGGAPNFIGSASELLRFQAATFKEGHAPRTADEATIDAATAKKQGWKLGDKVCAVAVAQRKCYTLVGTTQIAGLSSFGGATVLDVILPEAQRLLGKGTGFDEIQAAAKSGVTPRQLKAELQRTLPRSVDVRTGTEQAAKESKDI